MYEFVAVDLVVLACAIQGEGAHFFGEQRDLVGTWIAHTQMNYWETGWWRPWWEEQYESYDPIFAVVTAHRWHGAVNVSIPDEWAIKIAREAILREHDLARGAKFMLSGKDLATLGIEHKKGEAVFQIERGNHSLYFFELWPGI
jgi:hypothetical protein